MSKPWRWTPEGRRWRGYQTLRVKARFDPNLKLDEDSFTVTAQLPTLVMPKP